MRLSAKEKKAAKKQSASKSFRVKLAVAAIVLAGIAVSFLNTTALVTGNAHRIAFITAQQAPQGSEQTVIELLSEKYFVLQMHLDGIVDLSDYDLVVISRQAGDALFGGSGCEKALSGKATLFLSSDFAITCKLTTGGSVAPYMPWKVVSMKNYPTKDYSGIITPYATSESIPAVVASENDIILIRRNVNDAYLLLQTPNRAFFSVPQSSFAFTEDGKNIFLDSVSWLLAQQLS